MNQLIAELERLGFAFEAQTLRRWVPKPDGSRRGALRVILQCLRLRAQEQAR